MSGLSLTTKISWHVFVGAGLPANKCYPYREAVAFAGKPAPTNNAPVCGYAHRAASRRKRLTFSPLLQIVLQFYGTVVAVIMVYSGGYEGLPGFGCTVIAGKTVA